MSYPGLLSPDVDESEGSRGSRSHLRASGLPLSLSGLRVPTAWSLVDSTEFSLRVRTEVMASASLLCHVLLGDGLLHSFLLILREDQWAECPRGGPS